MPDLDLTGKLGSGVSGSARPKVPPTVAAAAAEQREEKSLKSELEDAFGRIGEMLAEKDEELSQAFEEDKGVLSQGLVNLTRSVKFLRGPVLLAVHLVQPLLAFGRIGGILARRVRDRWAAEEPPPAP